MKKNSHHLELNLVADLVQISHNDVELFLQNKNMSNIRIKIDLLSDDTLVNTNKVFQDAISKLKNQLIKVILSNKPNETYNIILF